MGSDDRDSAVYAPFAAIQRHCGYFHRIKGIGEALQLAPKVNTYSSMALSTACRRGRSEVAGPANARRRHPHTDAPTAPPGAPPSPQGQLHCARERAPAATTARHAHLAPVSTPGTPTATDCPPAPHARTTAAHRRGVTRCRRHLRWLGHRHIDTMFPVQLT